MIVRSGASVLVVDIGGSHVSAALCQSGTYCLGPVVRALHIAEQSSEAFLHLLHTLGIEASGRSTEVRGAEIAVPGPFDFKAGISRMQHKLPYIYGVDLRMELAKRFRWKPDQVRFLHDAAAFLLGEMGAGAAHGVKRAVGITLGTGIGSALAVDGCLVTKGPGVPPGGEIWNIPYNGGQVEDFVSARSIQDFYRRRTGKLREVVELASVAEEDRAAAEAFTEFGRHLGMALRAAFADFSPNVIVLGGGISRSPQLFLPAAQHELEGLNFKLRISTLLDDAPLVGAGVAWFNGSNGRFSQSETAAQAD